MRCGCRAGVRPDLLATSGDHLRIWSIQDSAVVLDRLLTNVSGVHLILESFKLAESAWSIQDSAAVLDKLLTDVFFLHKIHQWREVRELF